MNISESVISSEIIFLKESVLLTSADVVVCCVDPLEWKAMAIPKAVLALIKAGFEVPLS